MPAIASTEQSSSKVNSHRRIKSRHSYHCRRIIIPIIIFLAIPTFLILILWRLKYITFPTSKANSNPYTSTSTSTNPILTSTTWKQNKKFIIKPSNGYSYVGISNDSTRFMKCSNNDKFPYEYSFIEINDISASSSSFYLFWDIPTSISYCTMSKDGSMAIWAFKNHNNNHVEISYCTIHNPITCTKKEIEGSNVFYNVISISTSYNGKRVAIGIQSDVKEYFVRVYKYDGKSLTLFGNDILKYAALDSSIAFFSNDILDNNDSDDNDLESGKSGILISAINSLSVSEDGDVIAIGYSSTDTTNNISSSQVDVYTYNQLLPHWNKKDTILQNINNDNEQLFEITSTSLASNGNLIAIGSSSNTTANNQTGKCQLFQITNNIWKEITIQNKVSKVLLSGNGKRLFLSLSNRIQVYDYDEEHWIPVGLLSYDKSNVTITELSTTFNGDRIVISSYDMVHVFDEIVK